MVVLQFVVSFVVLLSLVMEGDGDSVPAEVAARPRRRPSRAGGAAASAAGDEESGGLCFACQEEGGVLDAVYRGKPMHRDCLAGVRSYCRASRNSPVTVELEKTNFASKQSVWRQDIGPFLPGSCRKSALILLEEACKQNEKYSTNARFRDKVEMPRGAYQEHMTRTAGMSMVDSSAKFDALWEEQGAAYYDSDDEEVVLIKELARHRHELGEKESTVTGRPNADNKHVPTCSGNALRGIVPGTASLPSTLHHSCSDLNSQVVIVGIPILFVC
jgi:hypothetical protein